MKLLFKVLAIVLFIFAAWQTTAILLLLFVVILWSFDPGASTTINTKSILALVAFVLSTVGAALLSRHIWKRSNR